MDIGVCHQIPWCSYSTQRHRSSLPTHWRKRLIFMFVVPVFLGSSRKRMTPVKSLGKGKEKKRQEWGSFPIAVALHRSFFHVLSIQTQWQKSLVRNNIFSGVAIIPIIKLIVAYSKNNGRKLCRGNQNSIYTSVASDIKWSNCLGWKIFCLLLLF